MAHQSKAPSDAMPKPRPRTPGVVNSQVKHEIAKRLNCSMRDIDKLTSLETLSDDDMAEIAAGLRATFGINIAPSVVKKWRKGGRLTIECAVHAAKEKHT